MKISTFGAIALAALILIPCGGCGSSAGGSPPALVPVKGKVLRKGQPVTWGIVRFEPDYGRPASGHLRPNGTFELTTNREGDGAVAGEHRVSISGFDKSLARDRSLWKYGSFATSGLTAEVSAEKAEFTFDLR